MRSSKARLSLRSRWIARTTITAALALGAATGCLDRPVGLQTPTTTNVIVRAVPHREIDKVDLLFMIDNSLSMADKQEILSDAVPVLVRRLVTPNCLDAEGRPNGTVTNDSGSCAQGRPEMRSVRDIHIGVITSSLGAHGGTQCATAPDDAAMLRTPDDRAELLPTANPAVRGALPSWNGSGFLAWDPGQDRNVPPGEGNLDALVQSFRDQVVGAGERGCGYEASLEAWYRFLVDPEPPVNVTSGPNAEGTHVVNTKGPVNQTILNQRKAFLRPDSLLAIVMLTDENDCSIDDEDGHQGLYVSRTSERLPRASSACVNPDDRCCHTCDAPAPEGCTPNDQDIECSKPGPLAELDDDANARCFDQKRRFGMDLLYPVQRYIDGLRSPKVPNRAGELVDNPIFAAEDGLPGRDESHVLLAGIVGVPWQDISTSESWTGAGLEYLSAAELAAQGRWDVILGNAGSAPTDPHMRESFAERSGTHPLLPSVSIAPSSSPSRTQNPINGHEQAIPEKDDLQYACTFPLSTPRPCEGADDDPSCDCNSVEQANLRSLCEYPNGPGTPGIQVAGKAYPGVRTLEVLRGIEENAIVASICPKHMDPAPGLAPAADPNYGYNPAVQAIVGVFQQRFRGQCLPRPLPVEADGSVPCAVIEAKPHAPGAACSCDPSKGRLPLGEGDAKLPTAVRTQLIDDDQCGGKSGIDCNDMCLCKLAALEGDAMTACQAGSEDPNLYGYCYVDPDNGYGSESLVEACGEHERRILRYMGGGVPANGSVLFTACVGAAWRDPGTQL
jgi:hypothetical protein